MQEQRKRSTCIKNLKELGLAIKMQAGESDRFHTQKESIVGGTKEFTDGRDTFRHFQALSNVITNTKLLICPSDSRLAANNFQTLTNSNLSYFIGLKGDDTKPDTILLGDRSFISSIPKSNGVLIPGSKGTFTWQKNLHLTPKLMQVGNITMSDGSIWSIPSEKLSELLTNRNNADNPLLFPE